MSNITPLFPLHVLAVFLKVIFNQKEKGGFIWPKSSGFLFQKPSSFYSEKMFLDSTFFHKYRKKQISIFVKSLKHKHKDELFHRCFSTFFLLFRNTYIKEYFWVAASIYFNRQASQKCENTWFMGSDYFLEGVLI